MHTGAEELSTGSRLTTVMKLIPVRGDKEMEEVGKQHCEETCTNDGITALEKVNINARNEEPSTGTGRSEL